MNSKDILVIDRLVCSTSPLEVISHVFKAYIIEPVDIIRMVIDEVDDKPHQKLKIKDELGIEL